MRIRIPLYKYFPRQLFGVVWLSLFGLQATAQTEQRYNRFQYHKFLWRSFHTKTFHVYFPLGNDSLCAFITREYTDATDEVKGSMISSLQKEATIIVCPSPDQLYESNIGSFEPKEYTLPTFVSKGNRLLLFFNGSYTDLKEQLKEAIARSIWEQQFKQGDLSGQAKGATKDDPIPLWLKEGAIRYFAHGWTIEAEDALRLSFKQNSFNSWQEVISYQPRLSGQAFCYFLSDKYYKEAVSALFFQLKKKKQLPRAIRLVAKKSLDSLYSECLGYYKERFGANTSNRMSEAVGISVPHKEGIVKTVQLSPDKQSVAYVLNTYNKRIVYCYSTQTRTTSKISTYLLPPWISDHSADIYPIISWDIKGKSIVVTQPINGRLTIRNFNANGTEIENVKLYGVDGLTTVIQTDYRQYLFAAYRKGQSDIVSYTDKKEKYTPFTSDIYDDTKPVIGGKSGQIDFVSSRPIKAIKRGDSIKLVQGIYSIQDKGIVPLRLDSISYINWDKPVRLQDNGILATHTKYGSERFALVNNNSTATLSECQPYQYLPQTNEISFYKNEKDTLRIQSEPAQKWINESTAKPSDTTSPWLKDYRKREAEETKEDSILARAKRNNPDFLEDVFTSKESKKHAKHIKDSIKKKEEYDPSKVKPYILQLHSAYFTTQVNNDYFINRYQPYLNYQGQFKFPEVGGMVQGGLTDLFENHHFKISYRLPAGSEGSDFFIHYQNTAKKVDWGATYFRKVESLKPDPNRNWVDEVGRQYPGAAKVKTTYSDISIHYPLSYDCSLGLQEAIRSDRTIFLATNKYSLQFNDIKSVWSITTVTGELNKQRPTVRNLFKGFKGNVAIDVFKGFSQDEAIVLGSTLHLQYDQPLYRQITLVVKVQGGYSAGDQKVLYTLGGVDNNLTPKVDSTVHFSQTAPYAFQSLVTPFRGYLQNSTNGNQYLLFNADIYFPIFQTLIPIENPLSSINNLQLGIFTDAGNAKETWQANINNTKWLCSYGFGARTTLAGYPLRLDIAWAGSFNKSPIWYLSLNWK